MFATSRAHTIGMILVSSVLLSGCSLMTGVAERSSETSGVAVRSTEFQLGYDAVAPYVGDPFSAVTQLVRTRGEAGACEEITWTWDTLNGSRANDNQVSDYRAGCRHAFKTLGWLR